ncbi:uncharacterized protein [Typha latifolia]|uniref:uncharacterized protein n=1 Tax=Typha latifolia TaxID=4733 RepID=UPI003C2EA6E2
MPTHERIASDKNPCPRPACFSLAAFGKAAISHLLAAGVAVAAGLSDSDLAAIEDTYSFSFPPDLRSILREGLPVAAGFPDWRSSSPQQLRLLLSLPSSSLAAAASEGRFWLPSWGAEPEIAADRAAAARWFLDRAPPLVPFYRHFYIPSVPSLASNPVFYVRGGEVRCAAVDVNDLLRRFDWAVSWPAPAWAAKSARRVDVWTEIAELYCGTSEGKGVARAGVERWLAEMGWRLRAAGWGRRRWMR